VDPAHKSYGETKQGVPNKEKAQNDRHLFAVKSDF
jgi:hypothetical protein